MFTMFQKLAVPIFMQKLLVEPVTMVHFVEEAWLSRYCLTFTVFLPEENQPKKTL
jgi:hypothetical protein